MLILLLWGNFFKKNKRPFDDYVAYFREGPLSDREIAAKLGVSRITISEDTFEHFVAQTFRSEVKAKKVKGKLDLERSNLELGFIRAFKQYSSIELASILSKIEDLRYEIESLNKKSEKGINEKINSLKSELNDLIKECSIREMKLYYECMKKTCCCS